jgi:hypothetical protein
VKTACAGFVPVLQHKGTESNQERMLQTAMFIGLGCGALVVVPLGFALENQRTPLLQTGN